MEALLNSKPGEPAKKDGPIYKVKAPFLKWLGAKTGLAPEILRDFRAEEPAPDAFPTADWRP